MDFEELSQEDIENLEFSNFRSKLFCGILYPEDESHAYALSELTTNHYKCLYIIHDRDVNEDNTPKKTHVHFILRFNNARYASSLAAELKIKPNYLQSCSSFRSYSLYMIHLDFPLRAQYLESEVCGTLYQEFLTVLNTVDSEVVKVQKILKYLEDNDYNIQRPKLLKWVCSNSLYDVYRRGYQIFNDILKQKVGLL